MKLWREKMVVHIDHDAVHVTGHSCLLLHIRLSRPNVYNIGRSPFVAV
jgi:hypothetical protein